VIRRCEGVFDGDVHTAEATLAASSCTLLCPPTTPGSAMTCFPAAAKVLPYRAVSGAAKCAEK
jgi:hypothetical protein